MPGKRSAGKIPLSRRLAELYPDIDSKNIYAAILCGEIYAEGERIRDPRQLVRRDCGIVWNREKYVGRGGYKLEGALDDLGIDPAGKACLDAGASTGGFTDCLLSRGALIVHAVDVGFNQLAWKLRTDPRVISREKTNIMSLEPEDLDPLPSLAVADLSFRSLRGAASRLLKLTGGGQVLALVKPQFEDPAEDGFDGIVRTRDAREAVLRSLMADLPVEGVHVLDAAASRVTGRKGNAEIFLLLSNSSSEDRDSVERRIVQALDDTESHRQGQASPPDKA